MRMSLWQKCVVVLLGVAVLGGATYFARIVFRPVRTGKIQVDPEGDLRSSLT